MSNLLPIVFDMWRPYYFEYSSRPVSERSVRWADFERRTIYKAESCGGIRRIDASEFDNLRFCDKNGYPFIYFMPWRGSLNVYDDEREEFYKNHPEEPERLRALLRKAEALLAAKKTAAAAPVAKLATA